MSMIKEFLFILRICSNRLLHVPVTILWLMLVLRHQWWKATSLWYRCLWWKHQQIYYGCKNPYGSLGLTVLQNGFHVLLSHLGERLWYWSRSVSERTAERGAGRLFHSPSNRVHDCVQELLGEDSASVATNLLKGCYVHWMRSCNRIARLICRDDRRKAFLQLCSSIRTEPDRNQVLLMFKTIADLFRETVPWVNWWLRDQNKSLLCKAFNEGDGWDSIPDDTNIVESLNHVLDRVMSKNVAIQSLENSL